MSQFFCREDCPECTKANYVCLGDIGDLSEPSCDGIECWNCKHKWLFESLEDSDITVEQAYIEQGFKKLEG